MEPATSNWYPRISSVVEAIPPMKWFCSRQNTRIPPRAITAAAVSPLCPAPMTTASKSLTAGAYSADPRGGRLGSGFEHLVPDLRALRPVAHEAYETALDAIAAGFPTRRRPGADST